jgi:predicted nuclease with TOPRIM domain
VKNIALVVLVAALIGLAGLYLRQSTKIMEAEAVNAGLRDQLAELQSHLDQQQERTVSLQTRLQNTREKAIAKSEEVSHLERALTNQTEAAVQSKNPMAEMFKDPQMKDFVKAQQKMVLSGMIDKNYASFFSRLGLGAQQAASLKDLIIKKSMVDAQTGMSMLSSSQDPDARTQIFEQSNAEKEGINSEIRQMLGEENYQDFLAYEKSQPERMSVGMFKDAQASGPTALSAEQEEHLIQALGEERQNFKFTTDLYDQTKIARDLSGNLSEEKVKQFQQERAQLDEKYLERARVILSDEQMPQFQKFLSSQSQLQNAALGMAAKMFGGKQVTK